MIPEVVVAGLLMDAGIEDVFVRRPGIVECADPVTIGRAVYTKDERMVGGERGSYSVSVYVCRTVDAEARRIADACERAIHDGSWERYGDGAIVSMDVSAPKFKEQDSSGRYVYEVGATIVADRRA